MKSVFEKNNSQIHICTHIPNKLKENATALIIIDKKLTIKMK